MRRLILLALLIAATAGAQTAPPPPPPAPRVIMKPVTTTAIRTITQYGDAVTIGPGTSLNAEALLPLFVSIGAIAKQNEQTYPTLGTALAQYVEAIFDANGVQVWP